SSPALVVAAAARLGQAGLLARPCSSPKLLLAGVSEVVEVHLLAVAVDPGRQQPEAVEPRPRLVPGAEVHAGRRAVQRHLDPPPALGGRPRPPGPAPSHGSSLPVGDNRYRPSVPRSGGTPSSVRLSRLTSAHEAQPASPSVSSTSASRLASTSRTP